MLNIEKYAEEIKKYIADDAGGISCIVQDLKNKEKPTCQNCADCELDAFNWLLEEYKEPILTDKEKTYLKNVIEPRKDKDNDIWVNKVRYSEFDVVTVYEEHPISKCPKAWSILNFIVTEEMPFKGLDLKKEYNIKELGL